MYMHVYTFQTEHALLFQYQVCHSKGKGGSDRLHQWFGPASGQDQEWTPVCGETLTHSRLKN